MALKPVLPVLFEQKAGKQMREVTVEQKLIKMVSLKGGMAIKLQSLTVAGLPDRLVLLPCGQMHFIELKSLGKKPRPIQLKRHEQLRAMGFDVRVIDSAEGVEQFMQEVTG